MTDNAQWRSRPTPRAKSLRQVIAQRRKGKAKEWSWLQKRAVALFLTYAEPGLEDDRCEKDEDLEKRQGYYPDAFLCYANTLIY